MPNLNKVREYRLARAWSQEQLAEMAGLSTRTVQRIENGEQPSLETLSALAAVFEIKVTDLTTEAPLKSGQALDDHISDARLQLALETQFFRSLLTAVVVCTMLYCLNRVTEPGSNWSLWVAVIWGSVLVIRALRLFVFKQWINRWQQKRLQKILRKQD
ncbi:helix-turn-helix domain-containing protein [Pantoea sp. Fr+CA_20]|uniref:helix-turn-helix domain-containing protein n=1 Tax=Pantoea TaxID=53335 RepID=UPI002118A855|nr:helix-turn-helix domain-containing protein [Pantoea sp. Fr+CA_20]